MTESAFPLLREQDFSADVETSGQDLRVTLRGTADLTVKPQLDRFLGELQAEAERRAVRQVSVDVRELEFMNSSCLKSLVWWIGAVQERRPGEKYRIVFVSSPNVYWQRRSLNALACLASDIISVET